MLTLQSIFFQVPCSCWPEDMSVSVVDSKAALEESLNNFQSEIPVLGLLGSPHLIDHDEPLVSDADVQLVCKYLRAYHDRTIAGIDRLFVESKKQCEQELQYLNTAWNCNSMIVYT